MSVGALLKVCVEGKAERWAVWLSRHPSQPWSGCVNALLFQACDVETHSPDGCLSNGDRPVLNEALMCIVYLFKWSAPALCPVPILRLLCCDLGKRPRRYLLLQTLCENSQLPCGRTEAGARREMSCPAALRGGEGFQRHSDLQTAAFCSITVEQPFPSALSSPDATWQPSLCLGPAEAKVLNGRSSLGV